MVDVTIGDTKKQFEIPSTNNEFDIISVGNIEITDTGNMSISLNPFPENWNDTELMYVELIKIPG